MDNNLANTTRTNYKYEEDRSDILTMEEDVLIRYDRYIYNILYWYTPTWSYIGHTDKVDSVITFSVCIFVCMFFYVVCNFFTPHAAGSSVAINIGISHLFHFMLYQIEFIKLYFSYPPALEKPS